MKRCSLKHGGAVANTNGRRMNSLSGKLLLGLSCFAAAIGLTAQPGLSQGASKGNSPGMRIYIDPQTGKLVSTPPPGQEPVPLSPQEIHAMSTSSEELVEVPSAKPGGGVTVDLQGRFQTPLIATIDANGKLKVQHADKLPVK